MSRNPTITYGEWVTYDPKNPKTRVPAQQEVIVMIRTPYKYDNGDTFFYCPKAIKVTTVKMRNLCIPEGRKGCYFDVCRVLRWRRVYDR